MASKQTFRGLSVCLRIRELTDSDVLPRRDIPALTPGS